MDFAEISRKKSKNIIFLEVSLFSFSLDISRDQLFS